MRPPSIVWFERIYLANLVYGVIVLVVTYGSVREWALARGTAAATSFVWGVVSSLIALLLWYLIARRASKIAKWILVVSTVLGAISLILSISVMLEVGTFYTVATAISAALGLFAIHYLFRSDAKLWFTQRPVDAETTSKIFS